ncbi:MAG: HAD-IIA family hydrolase [Stackebrandtia sp.]
MDLDDGRLWGEGRPLLQRYGVVLLDLDGVVYLLGEPIDGAAKAIDAVRANGGVPVFVTNNASRRAAEVARLLSGKGIEAGPGDVCTSAQTAAALLRDHCAPGSAVLVVGSTALAAEVAEVGLVPVDAPDGHEIVAVVQGYGPATGWRQLADAVVVVRAGAWWVATNTDATMPSPRGPLPGNGTMVAAVATALGRQPDVVAGKPAPAMLRRAVSAHPGREALMVGDRWDTDIAGARAANLPGMLVLSGTTTPRQVLDIPATARPQYLAWTVAGITQSHPVVDHDATSESRFSCRDWTVRAEDSRLHLDGEGEALDALRTLARAAWWTNDHVDGVSVRCDAESTAASAALRELDI